MTRCACRPWTVILGVFLVPAVGAAGPRVVSVNPTELAAVKARLAAGAGSLRPAVGGK
jgi:hypothetical protein